MGQVQGNWYKWVCFVYLRLGDGRERRYHVDQLSVRQVEEGVQGSTKEASMICLHSSMTTYTEILPEIKQKTPCQRLLTASKRLG